MPIRKARPRLFVPLWLLASFAALAQPSLTDGGRPDASAAADSAPGASLSTAGVTDGGLASDATGFLRAREEDHHLLETRIEAPAPTSAASAETIRDRDLMLRPKATPEDILRVVPGLVLAQHQGGGKADQLFLRGFDADHGTDVAIFVDGVPINMPTHGHGQGYADLHFLIPETIDRVDVSKGPYFPQYGDFDTAGALNLRTRRTFQESFVSATYGSFNTYRLLGVASPTAVDGLPWL